MSPLSKILPQALCCFLPPRDVEEDDTRPSTGQDAAPTVTRKPIPYAMINVPHQPDIADEQAFRRMLTASPACPVEASPTRNAQLRATRKQEKELSRHNFSMGVEHALPRGSSVLHCTHPAAKIARPMTSKPRLNKKSSKGRSRDSEPNRACENHTERVDDNTAATLATIAQPTGMVDILTPRNTSLAGYDSDAKVIKTPELDDAISMGKHTPEHKERVPTDAELMQTESASNKNHPSPLPVNTRVDSTPKRLTRSSPYPCTPEKISFTAALQPKASESPTVVLKRLSTGIANGSIKPPTDLELQTLRGPIASGAPDDWRSSLEAPLRWSSLQKDPDLPQTVIRRLSDMVQLEEKDHTNGDSANKESPSKRSSLLTQLDPVLLEYLSKFSQMTTMDLTLHQVTPTPETVIKKDKLTTIERVEEVGEPMSPEARSVDQSPAETPSVTSILPSEHDSVHLFNMNIPTRLESRSNATIFSPAASANGSRRSLDSPPPLPSVARNSPIRRIPLCGLGRAEHNRKPSDPHTRQIFEQPGRRYHPYWKSSVTSLAQSKPFSERDDTSSVYSTEYGAPGRSESPHLTNPLIARKNVNSLAVGGRSASTEIPVRRSSRSYSSTLQVPGRSFSAAGKGKSDSLNAATEVISRYLDGKVEDNGQSQASKHTPEISNDKTRAVDLGIENGPSKLARASRLDAVQLTPLHRSSSSPHLKRDNASMTTIARVTGDRDATRTPPSCLKESATDLWNRAYREARADSEAKDFLSKGDFNDDKIHLSPSGSLLQIPYRSRSNSILKTPRSALRRSQSVGADMRSSVRDGPANDNSNGNSVSRLTKTMQRLSFWNLKPQQQHESLDCTSWKPLRTNSDEVTKRRSATVFDVDRAANYRAAHTPPLRHYLGLWGSFPSHDREKRIGPAGKTDSVRIRNFGSEEVRDGLVGTRPATLRSRLSNNTLSLMQNTSKKIFSGRVNLLDRNKTKSMSLGSPIHRIEKGQGLLLKRWQRQYRTKSSEWRGYVTANGHRSSVSPELPAKYPELEQFQGVSGFDRSPRITSSFYKVDGASFGSVVSPASDHEVTDTPSKMTNAATQTSDRQPEKNKSSTWESIIFTNIDDNDARTKENANLRRLSNEVVGSPQKRFSAEGAATYPRTSRDLKMPGGFEEC